MKIACPNSLCTYGEASHPIDSDNTEREIAHPSAMVARDSIDGRGMVCYCRRLLYHNDADVLALQVDCVFSSGAPTSCASWPRGRPAMRSRPCGE